MLLEKNSTRKTAFAALFRVPWMAVAEPSDVADEMTGKFCNLFAPVSASLKSLAVIPAG